MIASVLIVDDEQSIVQSLSGLLSDEGFEVSAAVNGYDALKAIQSDSPDLVLLDIWMPGMDGIETLKEIKKFNPQIQVIIITGHGTIETAVKATKLGAFDLVEKPLSIDKIILSINNALNFKRLEEENKYLRTKTLEKHSIDGESERTKVLRKNIEVAAPTDTWILISGENGTTIGCAGLLAADVAGHWEIGRPLYVAELDLGAALAGRHQARRGRVEEDDDLAVDGEAGAAGAGHLVRVGGQEHVSRLVFETSTPAGELPFPLPEPQSWAAHHRPGNDRVPKE